MDDKPRRKVNVGRKFEKSKKSLGRLTVGSGNKWFDKGDLELENFLVELKATEKKSFSVKQTVIEKIKSEAIHKDKHWGILVDINGIEVLIVDNSWLEVINGLF